MEELKSIIGENLASLRKEKKLTQAELAERFNYTDKAVSKWEKGETSPDIETLYSLCEFYGVTIDYLTHPGNKQDKEEYVIKDSDFNSKVWQTALSVSIIWMVATLIFIYLLIFHKFSFHIWHIFVHTDGSRNVTKSHPHLSIVKLHKNFCNHFVIVILHKTKRNHFK